MLDSIWNTVMGDMTLTAVSAALTIGTALALGLLISFTYMMTHTKGMYSANFTVTLVMIPVILAIIILFVGSNVARAFSLAGTVSIIRFRSAPGDPKDIGYIFFTMAAGLACGVGLYWYGAVFTLILCIVMVLLYKMHYGIKKTADKQLKIVIPENLDYENAFSDIFDKYAAAYELKKTRTADLGSLYELVYTLRLNHGVKEKEFIDELRCRNGNLNITLVMTPDSWEV